MHVNWKDHESHAFFRATWFRFVAMAFVSETIRGRQDRRQVVKRLETMVEHEFTVS